MPFLGALAAGRNAALDKQQKNQQLQNAQQFQAIKFGMDAVHNQAENRHLDAETKKLGEPDKPHWDEERGIYVSPTGTTPVPGVTPRERAPLPGTPEATAWEETKAKIAAKYRPAPAINNVYLPSVDPTTGKTVYTVAPSKGDGPTKQLNIEKPQAGQGGSAQGAQAPVADMQQRYQEIEQHAKDLGVGKWKMNRKMQVREGLGYGVARDVAGGGVPMGKMLGADAMDLLHVNGGLGGQDYQQYQDLMTSTRALGDDVAKVFKGRQNEQSVLREVALAEITPDDYKNPVTVARKLSRLRNVIKLAEITNPRQMAAMAAEGTKSPTDVPGDINLGAPPKKRTAAEILAKHNIKP